LNYLWWNSTQNPQGPPLHFSDQNALFASFNTEGGLYLSGNEMTSGLNTNRPLPVDTYGYFFAPYANTSVAPVVQQICIWLDYSMDFYNQCHQLPWPKPGYPNHVPIAIPTGGNYNSWMVVRGIHTDRYAWQQYPDFPAINVYGFWLNDPKSGGFGGNTYVTANQFITSYYQPINVVGDTYQNQYLAIVEPPEGISVGTGDVVATLAQTPYGYMGNDAKIVQAGIKNSAALREIAFNILIKTARNAVENVLKFDSSDLAAQFAQTTIVGKPVIKGSEAIIFFAHDKVIFEVHLEVKTGSLLEFRISGL